MKKPYYKEINNEIEIFKHAFKKKLPVMLTGPTGCGKSRFVEKMAAELNIPLIQVACNEETSSVDLLGRFLIKGTNTIWQDGPVTKSVKEGCILYLDEISEAREDVIVVLHPLADYRRQIYLDRTCETISAKENFMLTASYNPEYQKSFKELKPSTKQRFVCIQFDYPEKNTEIEIINHETGLSKNTASVLVNYANKIRNFKEMEISETISTRLLINASKLIISGMTEKMACYTSIISPLTDDKDIQENLKDILNIIL